MARARPLHIAASLRVIARHKPAAVISLQAARDIIQGAAAAPSLSHDDRLMVEELERVTGESIAELADLANQWLPRK
jgi:hypothetical protein